MVVDAEAVLNVEILVVVDVISVDERRVNTNTTATEIPTRMIIDNPPKYLGKRRRLMTDDSFFVFALSTKKS